MTLNTRVLVACILATCAGCGAGRRSITVVPDVRIHFAGQERLPRPDRNARLTAAAREVRELLGHALLIEFDAVLAPRNGDEFDETLIKLFEPLAEGLVYLREDRSAAFIMAQRHLARIIVKYVPGATGDERGPRLEGNGTVVVPCVAREESVRVGEIIDLLERTSEAAGPDPASAPPAPRDGSTSAIAADSSRERTDLHVLRGARGRHDDSPEQARVSAVAAFIERSLGHAMTIEVDPALIPKSRPAFLEQSAAALELLVQYLAHDVEKDPLFHAFVQRRLQRVVVRYRASTTSVKMNFDEATGTLTYTMRVYSDWMPYGQKPYEWNPQATYLVTPDDALRPAFNRELHARFGEVDERRLAAGDFALYHRYLQTLEEPIGAGALLRFERHTRGAAVHGDVERSTAAMAAWLSKHPSGAESAALRRAYATWVAERFFGLHKLTRNELYHAIFSYSTCVEDPCVHFPELDRTGLAVSILEKFAAPDAEAFGAEGAPLCYSHAVDSDELSWRPYCGSIFTFLTATHARAERLVAVLSGTKRRDFLLAALTEAARSARHGHPEKLLVSLAAKGGPLYADALRITAKSFEDRLFYFPVEPLVAEARRVGADRADLRPVFLGILFEHFGTKLLHWDTFSAALSHLGGLDAALFVRFLDEGPRSVELAVKMWSVVSGSVPTPFEIVASRLDAYLGSKRDDSERTVTELVRQACRTGDKEGLRVILTVLEKPAVSGYADALALARDARRCKEEGK